MARADHDQNKGERAGPDQNEGERAEPEPDQSGSRRSLPVTDAGSGPVSKGAKAAAAAEAEARRAEGGERDRPEPEPIELDENERELIEMEMESVGPASDPRRAAAYQALREAASDGTVPVELVPLLERVVAIALESGRARRRYLAEGEKILTGLFKRTPAGKELLENMRGVNKALDVLNGREISDVKVGLRTLGHIRLVIETDEVNLTLAVRPSAVMVESLSVLGSKD